MPIFRLRSIALALVLVGATSCVTVAPPSAPASQAGLECLGQRTDRPTVILEAGAFGGAGDWSLVAADLARRGKVCAYDRSRGFGQLDLDRSPVAIANRLETLVAREEGDRPVILAGHSNGGLYVEAFARQWPEHTAGLLLIDAVDTDVSGHALALADLKREERLSVLVPIARAVGLTRLAPIDDITPSAEVAARRRHVWTDRESVRVAANEVRDFLPGLPAVSALPPLRPAIPVAVIAASRAPTAKLDRDKRAAQAAPADRACRGLVLDVQASHTSILDAQRGAVSEAVDWLAGEHPELGTRRC